MKASDRVEMERGMDKNGRGSVRNDDRLEAFSQATPTGGADWGSANSELLGAVVVSITALGGAVTFGMSRNQGAHSVTLMLGGKKQTLWYNGDAELDEALSTIVDTLTQIT